jgi:hypothetical protein
VKENFSSCRTIIIQVNSNFKSDTKISIASLQERVLSYIETSTIISSVFGFISTILIVYIAFKILSAVIQARYHNDITTKSIKMTQVHEPTHVNAQTLEKELALLKANLASNIFPRLPTENAYIKSTFNSRI